MRKDQGFGCSNLSITLGPRFMLCSAGQRKIVAAFWCVKHSRSRKHCMEPPGDAQGGGRSHKEDHGRARVRRNGQWKRTMRLFDRGPRREGSIEKPHASAFIFGAVLLARTPPMSQHHAKGQGRRKVVRAGEQLCLLTTAC